MDGAVEFHFKGSVTLWEWLRVGHGATALSGPVNKLPPEKGGPFQFPDFLSHLSSILQFIFFLKFYVRKDYMMSYINIKLLLL